MKTPKTSKHFKKIVDGKSGVAHYVLSTRLAEYQQGFFNEIATQINSTIETLK